MISAISRTARRRPGHRGESERRSRGFTALLPLLFDLESDPDDLHDLAGDPAHVTTVLDYAQKMLSWRMAHDERTLTGIQLTPNGPIERPRARR